MSPEEKLRDYLTLLLRDIRDETRPAPFMAIEIDHKHAETTWCRLYARLRSRIAITQKYLVENYPIKYAGVSAWTLSTDDVSTSLWGDHMKVVETRFVISKSLKTDAFYVSTLILKREDYMGQPDRLVLAKVLDQDWDGVRPAKRVFAVAETQSDADGIAVLATMAA